MPKIYCGTWAKYNAGSLFGKWFDLEDYADKDEFIEACLEYHKGEEDPELHFQDWQDIPDRFIGESHIDPEFWEYKDYDDRCDGAAKEAYCECFGEWNKDDFEERFRGKYDSWEDMAEQLLDETGELSEIPERLRYYFNYKKYANDLRCGGDLTESNCFYFWSH